MVLESLSLAGCLREIRHIKGESSYREWLRNTRNSALFVVLGEDIAALLGLVLAFGFLSMAALTGNPVYDAVGSMCIGLILIVISVFLSQRVRALLVGQSAGPHIRKVIDEIISNEPKIDSVFNTITLQFGPDLMLATKIRLSSDLSIDEAVGVINGLERHLKERVSGLKWIFVEPDIED
jgi:divalent metal cation (Fe/Co/Zn/Cd) transporter